MIGIEGAIDLVIARLQAEMPAKVAEVAARYVDAAAVNLREPSTYASSIYTRKELAQYPVIEVAPRSDGIPVQNDQFQGVENLTFPYSVRVYLIERGASYQQVEKRRQRLTLAVKEVISSAPQLSATPFAWSDVKTMRSSYFGTGEVDDRDNRSIAATYTDVVVMVQEMTEPSPDNPFTVATVEATVHPSAR